MKRLTLLLGGVLAATTAQAQIVTSQGTPLGYECFLKARFSTATLAGLEVCNTALNREVMNVNDRAATYDNRGVILNQLQRLDEAEADFVHAIALKPDLGDAYVNRGSVLIRRQRYDDALVQIEKGIALGTSFPHIGIYNRALALQLLGRVREAYDGYNKVLAMEPDFAPARERLKDFTVVRRPAAT
jgi:tetratricopeptide (TPR) repeat protein